MAADSSTPARQPQETHGHRGWTDELTAPATSVSRQSVDGDERRFQMLTTITHNLHLLLSPLGRPGLIVVMC